jgi:hypothetical protein
MVSRILTTSILILLAVGAFWSNALDAGRRIDPLGVLCWVLAILNWYGWDTMRAGWSYGRERDRGGTDLPLLARFGPIYIKGIMNLRRTAPPRRTSSEGARE